MLQRSVPYTVRKRAGVLSERGVGLVETLISAAIAAIAITALLAALSTGSMAVQRSDEGTTSENLARAQMEYTKGLAYLTAPASYATVSTPAGYSISTNAASLSGRDADIQKITVTVTYNGDTFVMEGFKSDRLTSGSPTPTPTPTPTPAILLDDGFEGDPWDANWDGQGSTAWDQTGTKVHSGSWAALSKKGSKNNLTTDDLDASSVSQIRVSFWYEADNLDSGDIIIYRYNPGTGQYVEWYDILDYSTYQDSAWCYFDEYINDSQYFQSSFRLRFNSTINSTGQEFYLDDVLVRGS